MICIKAAHKFFTSVTLITVMVFMIPPVYAGANHDMESSSGHPQRFWDARSPDPAVMVADGLLVRPASFVATILGGTFYLITLPFSAAGGNSGEAWDQMVKAPARATFVRPLGVFHLDFEHEQETTDNSVRDVSGPASVQEEPLQDD